MIRASPHDLNLFIWSSLFTNILLIDPKVGCSDGLILNPQAAGGAADRGDLQL